jgi:GT2 family glycosyltransferase
MPTHGRRDSLPVVLAPLLEDPLIDELLVVVDGSRDGSFEWLQQQSIRRPRLVPLFRERAGGAQVARAAGLERATGDVVLFLDDDVLAGRGLAGGHLAHHERRTGAVVVGFMPVALPPRRRPGQFPSYLYAEEYRRRCAEYEATPSSILRNLWWGNVSMRRSQGLAVGMVSPGFERSYHEDKDFGLRCLVAGLEGVFDRGLVADHLHSRDIDAFARDARSQGAARVILHQRHEDLIGALSPTAFSEGLAPPLSRLVERSRNPRVASSASAVLRVMTVTAGSLRLYGLETRTGKLLRRVNQRSGAQAVLSDRDALDRHSVAGSR